MAPYSYESVPTVVQAVTHVLALVLLVFVTIWSLSYRGGMAWVAENKQLIFNWHPVLMVIFVVLAGEGTLAYRILPFNKQTRKTIHLSLHALGLFSALLGIYAAYKYHSEAGIMHFYSLHSWFGIATAILFSVQWGFGLVTYLYPGASLDTRRRSLPWHAFLGLYIFFLAITTATQGALEKLTFLILGKLITQLGSENVFVNVFGLLLFVFAGFVALTALKHDKVEDEGYEALE